MNNESQVSTEKDCISKAPTGNTDQTEIKESLIKGLLFKMRKSEEKPEGIVLSVGQGGVGRRSITIPGPNRPGGRGHQSQKKEQARATCRHLGSC